MSKNTGNPFIDDIRRQPASDGALIPLKKVIEIVNHNWPHGLKGAERTRCDLQDAAIDFNNFPGASLLPKTKKAARMPDCPCC